MTTIDFRRDPVKARRHRVVSPVTYADIPDIVWAVTVVQLAIGPR